jgi:hypothetical protein
MDGEDRQLRSLELQVPRIPASEGGLGRAVVSEASNPGDGTGPNIVIERVMAVGDISSAVRDPVFGAGPYRFRTPPSWMFYAGGDRPPAAREPRVGTRLTEVVWEGRRTLTDGQVLTNPWRFLARFAAERPPGEPYIQFWFVGETDGRKFAWVRTTDFSLADCAPAGCITGTVVDGVHAREGHENALDGAVVELFQGGARVAGPIAAEDGAFLFTGIAPGDYRLRAHLQDSPPPPADPIFEVRHTDGAMEPVWVDVAVRLRAGDDIVYRSVPFTHGLPVVDSNVPAANRDRLDDMANMFFRMRQYTDWLTESLGASLSIPARPQPVEIYAWSAGAGFENAEYRDGDTSVHISPELSPYSLHDDPSNDAGPESIEWHEYNHHVYSVNIDAAPCGGGNHGGYRNASTCDSVDEGLAAFMPVAAWGDIEGRVDSLYDAFGVNLEDNGLDAWGSIPVSFIPGGPATNVQREEFAVAAVFWDLIDPIEDAEATEVIDPLGMHVPATFTDRVSIPIRRLWDVIEGGNLRTMAAIRAALIASPAVPQALKAVSVDLDGDGVADVSRLDEPFLMHGFYSVEAVEAAVAHSHYDVGVADKLGIPGAERNRGVGRTDSPHPLPPGALRSPREMIPRAPSSYVKLDVTDSEGSSVDASTALVTVEYPEMTDDLKLPIDENGLFYLELPPYFTGPLADGEPLPACGPGEQYEVNVEVSARAGRAQSVDSATFDNCEYFRAIATATEGYALEIDLTVPTKTTTTLGVKKTKRKLSAVGRMRPRVRGAKMMVTLSRIKQGAFKVLAVKRPRLTAKGSYSATFTRPKPGRCRLTATFAGDADHLSSSRTRRFRC